MVAPTPNARQIVLDGTITYPQEGLDVRDGLARFEDTNGPASNTGIWRDGSADIEDDSNLHSRTYEFVRPIDYTYMNGSTQETAFGVLGVPTDDSLVPSGGTVTYTGSSYGIYSVSGSNQSLTGTSRVAANFGSDRVNTTIEVTNSTNVPYDRITINNMVVSGNDFSGGTVRVFDGNTEVNPTGSGGTRVARGGFFGYDPSINAPDEVGGYVQITGSDATVYSDFLAD